MTDPQDQEIKPDQDWKREHYPFMEWDASRYDRDDDPDTCQVCGTELQSRGGRSGVKKWCLECDVVVMMI